MKRPENAAIGKHDERIPSPFALRSNWPTSFPPRRVVILGASNTARGISTIVETSRILLGAPIDLLAAIGHGRSYGWTSCVLGRSLPAIVRCGLWEDLRQRPAVPTVSLVTDVGNDLLYGARVEQIVGWVERCLERLKPVCYRIVLTELPLASLRRLDPFRFRFMRTLLFPRSRLSLPDALLRAEQLNGQIVDLAVQYEVIVRRPDIDWYGFDPIHIRCRRWRTAWQDILFAWNEEDERPLANGSFLRWLRLRSQRPLSRRLFGFHQQRDQPTCALRDGSFVSFY